MITIFGVRLIGKVTYTPLGASRLAALRLALGLPLAACGLTADFSGLQGGVADAGRDSSMDGAADAPAADVMDAGAAGFCGRVSPPVRLCADFDEGGPVSAGWTSTDVYAGDTVGVDNVYFSPPGSFLGSITQSTTPSSARLQEDLPLDAQKVHVEFEMLLPPVSGNLEICTLHQQLADGTTYGVFYKYENGNLLIFLRTLGGDGGEVDVVNPIGPPPAGWMHVDIDVVVGPSGNIVVKHDGAVVVNDTGVNTSTDSRQSMFVELGYYSFAPATAVAHFDNVIIDWP